MQYSYDELIEDLDMGREIEFIYKNSKYYIGCGTGGYMFWKFGDISSEIIGKNAKDLLSKVNINGKTIKGIWDLIEIDMIY